MGILTNLPSGGGAGLNFDVFAVPDLNSLPGTAKENTIAVVTTIPITGWVLSYVQPSSPTAGLVWIQISNSSPRPFNGVRKNELVIYITGNCSQFSNVWVKKDIRIYQSGTWQPLEFIIFPGTTAQFHATVNTGTNGSWWSALSGTGLTNANSRVVYIAIDLTPFSSLVINRTLTISGSGSGQYAGIWLANTAMSNKSNFAYPYYSVGQGSSTADYVMVSRITTTSTLAGDVTWDVSALSGTYYLAVGCYVNGTGAHNSRAEIFSVKCVY